MSSDGEVGYGKPPLHSRFKKGQSGNPKGRPKGTKNLKTDLREELQQPIMVREGERPLKISKQRAMVKALFAKSLKGDARSTHTLVNLLRALDLVENTDDTSNTDEQEDRCRKEEWFRRLTIEEQEMLLYLNRKARGEADESEAEVIKMRLLTSLSAATVQK